MSRYRHVRRFLGTGDLSWCRECDVPLVSEELHDKTHQIVEQARRTR